MALIVPICVSVSLELLSLSAHLTKDFPLPQWVSLYYEISLKSHREIRQHTKGNGVLCRKSTYNSRNSFFSQVYAKGALSWLYVLIPQSSNGTACLETDFHMQIAILSLHIYIGRNTIGLKEKLISSTWKFSPVSSLGQDAVVAGLGIGPHSCTITLLLWNATKRNTYRCAASSLQCSLLTYVLFPGNSKFTVW